MNRRRLIPLLASAIVVIAVALYLAAQRDRPQTTEGAALLPAFAAELNAVNSVSVRNGGAAPSVTLHLKGTQWTVAQRADYPADVSKIRTLLLALRDARIVEEKTANPAQFAGIGVDDPASGASAAGAGAAETSAPADGRAAPTPAGTEVTVVGPAFTHAVIVGKPVGGGNFVRIAGANQTYSIEPSISVETEPRYWIDSRLLDEPVALLQSIEVKPAGGPPYTLHRLNPADDTYTLDGVPAGRQPLDGHALAPGPTAFTGVTAEDVAPDADIDFSHASQVVVTLTDGNVITVQGAIAGTKHWIELKTTKDAALSTKTQGRAFEIASYRYDAMFKPLEQLLVPKAPPPPSPAKTPAPARTPAAASPTGGPPQKSHDPKAAASSHPP